MSGYVQRVKQLAEHFRPRLGTLDIELTERCNNDCIHCCINLPANDSGVRSREMTAEQVKDILKQAAELGCLQVRFTGGEPLLRPDFEELYLFARRLGLKVLLFTNARLITPHLADLFARVPPKVEIEITVYGMHRLSYEAVTRAPGSFAHFWRGVNVLLERKVPFIVKSARLPQNRHEMDEFETWARTIPWMTKSPIYSMFFDLRNRRDNAEKNRLIESIRVSPQDGLALLTRDEVKHRKEMAAFGPQFMGPPGDRLFRCGACEGRGMCVDAYGRAQPCLGVRAPELTVDVAGTGCVPAAQGDRNRSTVTDRRYGGGHKRVSLRDALVLFSRLRDLRATNPDYLRRCARCFLKGLCEQCPAKSWPEHGTLDTPVDYLCEVAHAQARYLGWLGESERAWAVADWEERVVQKRNRVCVTDAAACRLEERTERSGESVEFKPDATPGNRSKIRRGVHARNMRRERDEYK